MRTWGRLDVDIALYRVMEREMSMGSWVKLDSFLMGYSSGYELGMGHSLDVIHLLCWQAKGVSDGSAAI